MGSSFGCPLCVSVVSSSLDIFGNSKKYPCWKPSGCVFRRKQAVFCSSAELHRPVVTISEKGYCLDERIGVPRLRGQHGSAEESRPTLQGPRPIRCPFCQR